MTLLSNPEGINEQTRLRALAYREERVVGRFLLEGEDAHYLKTIAAERNMDVAALVKQFTIEGLWRARTYKEL